MSLNLRNWTGPGLGWTLSERSKRKWKIIHLRDSNGRKMKLGNNKYYGVSDSRKYEKWNLNKWIITYTIKFESVTIMFKIWSSCTAV